MNHIDTVDAIVDLANTGQQMTADEALGAVVKLINDLCPTSQNYDSRLATLMQIGATLWNLSEVVRHADLESSIYPAPLRSEAGTHVPACCKSSFQ